MRDVVPQAKWENSNGFSLSGNSNKQVDRRIENLINHWATNDYQAATQWATSQSMSKDREQVLNTIHRYWPEQDPAGKETFAQKHGIK